HEAQLVRVKAQGLVLIVHVLIHQLDLHVARSFLSSVDCRQADWLAARRGLRLGWLARLSATAARTSAFKAAAFTLSPSRRSMARLPFPSRLELNRPAGSASAAPRAKVSLTAFL